MLTHKVSLKCVQNMLIKFYPEFLDNLLLPRIQCMQIKCAFIRFIYYGNIIYSSLTNHQRLVVSSSSTMFIRYDRLNIDTWWGI